MLSARIVETAKIALHLQRGTLSCEDFFFQLFAMNKINPTFALLKFCLMYAIVKIAGQQFKVQQGQNLYVPHLDGQAGDTVEFTDVLLTDNGDTLSTGADVKLKVKAEIVGEVQGNKVIAFKMKRRKGFRKKHGHRTLFTHIKVTDIA